MNNREKTALQKEIKDSLPSEPHGRALLAPRSGKTKLAIDIIKRDKPNSILWVTPSSELAEIDIPKEFNLWKAKKYLDRLTTVTWMSLYKMKGYYDFIILDEEQFITENNIEPLFNGDITYNNIFSMTGSPTEREEKQLLYKVLKLKVLYRLPINQAVDIGLLSDYTINVITTHLGVTKDYLAGNKKKRFLTTESKNYDYLSKQVKLAMSTGRRDAKFKILARVRAIKNSPSKHKIAEYLMENLKGRKLFFTGSIAQAESLSKTNYHSKTDNKDLQAFIKGDIDTITMVNAGGTGFTYKKIDHLVLTQTDSNKNGLTGQKIARTLLKQRGYKATVWIICLLGTQDEVWIESTFKSFDENKINYISFQDLKEKKLC